MQLIKRQGGTVRVEAMARLLDWRSGIHSGACCQLEPPVMMDNAAKLLHIGLFPDLRVLNKDNIV